MGTRLSWCLCGAEWELGGVGQQFVCYKFTSLRLACECERVNTGG